MVTSKKIKQINKVIEDIQESFVEFLSKQTSKVRKVEDATDEEIEYIKERVKNNIKVHVDNCWYI